MARREITQFFDDLDDTPLAEDQVNVVDFSLNGVDYTLDLSAKNREAFDKALEPFIKVARRKTRAGVAGRRVASRSANPERNRMIREWARENNIEVSERGRISADVIEKFEKAQGQ
ncbi:histone-like nucleoid-structuring protein Lsr2 [Corynebacterium macclintockiae]|uniref:Lsr2 family protein n=1 Tax=Corynebacterium macclintockiae TaxID=2913501 RepID=A0A9X3M7F9_9CORY|nr:MULTISPECIES: Lsr2 family protein [Corynebacterium]MBC6794743.1 Lsr2 family protein [Corynebacterium sp. LK28]MCZ9305535.1 Lsr2 family protein [Corynebacterium macclintockiae]MDK8870285.1 Lsr2 family protein [Corynebacterium macclintockiae]MDK8891770.1 Lsr2 family protein [Corynebacterium macclintockiae]OFM57663.1 histone [Corynebacterium sp. HMSC058E07]